MTIEDRITSAKELIAKREQIDTELATLFNGGSVSRKTNKCSKCGQEGHSARTCENKEQPKLQPAPTPQSTSPQAGSFMSGFIKT